MTALKTIQRLIAATCLSVTALSAAHADVINLNFEGVAAGSTAFVQGFYNGATSSDGLSGVNYGIEFSSNALGLCLAIPGDVCSNTSHGGVGVPGSERGGLFFLDGSETFMNSAAGFDTGFALNYSAVNFSGSVTIWSGLNGTGAVLGTLDLALTPAGCSIVSFCPFYSAGTAFTGVAHSVTFAGVGNQIVFDDVTFGSASTPPVTPVPEPETYAMMLGGLGLLGFMARRRQKRA